MLELCKLGPEMFNVDFSHKLLSYNWYWLLLLFIELVNGTMAGSQFLNEPGIDDGDTESAS